MPARKPAAAQRKPEPPAKKYPFYGEKELGSVSGNLTRDPELRFTQTGRAVCNLAVASTERYKDEETGRWEDGETTYTDVTAWGNLGENCAEYLDKGDRVVADGYFQDRTYLNADGDEVTRTEFTAQDLGPSMLFKGAKIDRPERRVKASQPGLPF